MNKRLTRWMVYVLIAIGFAVACAFLSNWQFERNESRAEQIELSALRCSSLGGP